MSNLFTKYTFLFVITVSIVLVISSCKNRKKTLKPEPVVAAEDTVGGKCRLDYKNAKALSRYVKENEFRFDWVSAKANVES